MRGPYTLGIVSDGIDYVQEEKINFSFQTQTAQVFKKELPTLVLNKELVPKNWMENISEDMKIIFDGF